MFVFVIEVVLITGICMAGIIGLMLYWRKQWLVSYLRTEEEPDGSYQVVMRKRSPYHKIAIAKSEDVYYLYANGMRMTSTNKAEAQYAEAMVHLPMAAAVNREAVLIIGSGIGTTTREVLRYEEIETLTAVDLDPMIVELGMTYKPFVSFTNGSLNDTRVNNVQGDGRAYIENCSDRWDVILIDLPAPSSLDFELSKLYSVEFYRLLKARLNPGGVIAIQCPLVSLMPAYIAAVQATLRTAGFTVVLYHASDVVDFAYSNVICLAALRPINPESIAPLKELKHWSKEQLADMFTIPRYLHTEWDEDEVQTDRNTLLIDIVEHEFDEELE